MKEVKFGSNWLAQAEHGGFYQSAVDGTYEACGLKVSILPGGPQVNNRALLLAGKIDYHMGGDLLQAFNAVKEGIPIVAVAASFQKHPQVIIAHPGEAEKFEDLNLVKPLLRVLKAENYIEPTPIQTQAIPIVLNGNDILGIAQTGTGKTAAFGLPILQILSKIETRPITRSTRALILAPTRELVIQIGDAIRTYGREVPLRYTVIYGGVSQHPQIKAMKRGVDILVATPGRLLDLIEQKFIRLDQVTHFVLDEADRMLDMGFEPQIKELMRSLLVLA